MPVAPKATAGSPQADLGVPGYKCCPTHAILKLFRDAASAASQTPVPGERQEVSAQQGQRTTEVEGHLAVPEKVAELVAAWEKGPASSACFFALFLAVFVAADAAPQNLGFGAINVVAVLLGDVTAKVSEGPANQGAVKCGHAVARGRSI